MAVLMNKSTWSNHIKNDLQFSEESFCIVQLHHEKWIILVDHVNDIVIAGDDARGIGRLKLYFLLGKESRTIALFLGY